MNYLNKLLIFLLKNLRPLLGPGACKFEIGCTRFAILQLQEHTVGKATWNICKRLISCNPFT